MGDAEAENYNIPIAPGTSGIIPLTVDNGGDDAGTIQIGVTISKAELDGNGNPEMDVELQKRLFFYADTDKTYIFDEGKNTETAETVTKVYLGVSAPNNYTYTVLPGQKLTMNEIFYNDVPLKWEWVYDLLGYYFRGTVEGDTASVDEYLCPIEYDYDYDQPVFDEETGKLTSVQGKTAAEFLKEFSKNDGYKGTIRAEGEKLYYPVEVDEQGYGVWAYLCTKEEILEGIAYDTAMATDDTVVTATAKIILTAANVPAKVETVTTEKELAEALKNTTSNQVELNSDISLENTVCFDTGNKILDLNGYGINYNGKESEYSMIAVEDGASLTVVNGDLTGTSAATAIGAIKKKAFNSRGGNLILNGVDITGFDSAVNVEDMAAEMDGDSIVQITNCNFDTEQIAVLIQGNGDKTDSRTKLILQNSTINSRYYCGISGQGNSERWGTEIVISESDVSGCYSGIYLPQGDSVATITDSKISGNTGIAVKGGSTTIYNSEIIGTGALAIADAAIVGSGFTDTGDAIYMEAGYDWSVTLCVKGEKTKVISEQANAVQLFGENGKGPGKVYLYDGSYSTNAEGRYSAKWNDVGTFEIYGGTYDDSVSDTITRYDVNTTEE